ncbi:MAG: type II toxin-antitoxin system MqsA family antitoxin [Spirochaetales bacterium]|nr:type II toxin-antitoxin system MqsA family antitoxin [Spirochaetales bacterium]
MKQQDLKLCPLCESPLVKESRNVNAVYKDKNFSYLQPGEWCSECGEGFLSSEDLALSKQERTDQKRIIDHRLISGEIRKFRKSNKLSQKKASELFGGGPKAFSKYERGEVIQNKSLDILMRLINARKISIGDVEDVEIAAEAEPRVGV